MKAKPDDSNKTNETKQWKFTKSDNTNKYDNVIVHIHMF